MVPLDFPVKPSDNSITSNQNKTSLKDLYQYDPTLIETLEEDHKQLFVLFNQVLDVARNNKFITLQLGLVEFATAFTTHIELEDEKLYGYLTMLASNKSELEQKIVSDYSQEMKNISISIFKLLNFSHSSPITKHNVSKFIEDFEKIGELLMDRIEREENILYPIYKKNCT